MKFKLSILFLICFMINSAILAHLSEDISVYNNWLKETPSNENRIKVFNLAKEISHTDAKLSNEIVSLLMLKTDVQHNDSLFIHCLMLQAKNDIINRESDQADQRLKQALRLAEKINSLDLQTQVLYQLGETQRQLNQHNKAWLYFQTAEKLLPKNSINPLVIKIQIGLSACSSNENNLINSKQYADSALSLSQQLNDKVLISESYLQLATIAQNDKNFTLEKTLLNQAWIALHPDTSSSIANKILIHQHKCALQLKDTLSAINYLARAIELQDHNNKIKMANKVRDQLVILNNFDKSKPINYFWSSILIVINILAIVGIVLFLRVINKKRAANESTLRNLKDKEKLLDTEVVDFDQAVNQELKHTIEKCESELLERQANYPKLEDALEFSKQADYLKDLFLAKLSHEVRSPLTTILGFSSLLETELAMMEHNDLFDFASNITQSGQSLIELLNNIFDLSLINSNKLELKISSFDVGVVAQELTKKYESQASQKGLRIVVSNNDHVSIESDRGLVDRVLSMVIDNSVRFTEKGYIKIDIQPGKDKKLVHIQIKDTGVGIDKTYLEDVFEPYRKEKLGYSTLYQGVGLSLPLAKKIVQILGGTIEIESEKGIGTTVFFSIPLKHSPIISSDNKEITIQKPLKQEENKFKNVLLIEPDELNQLIIEKLLKKTYEIVPVDNCTQAKIYLEDALKKE